MSDQAVLNTDREIWRERHNDNYADSIHVTERGGIGINCGGMVYVKPVREWHKSAATIASLTAEVERLRGALEPFAKAADIKLCGEWRDDERFGQTDVSFHLTFGDLRRARAALSAEWCPPAQAIEQAKEALEVSVRDLKEAFDAFRALMEPAPSSSDNHPSALKND